ncbi:hypothetical protein BGW39_005121, partial [Mortierella sp. 14UC]
MRLKDSYKYLCLSILLYRISLLALLLSAFTEVAAAAAASPRMLASSSPDIRHIPLINDHLAAAASASGQQGQNSKRIVIPPNLHHHKHTASGPSLEIDLLGGGRNKNSNSNNNRSPAKGNPVPKSHHQKRAPISKPEYQLIPRALLTTVDGDLHCINTKNGEVVWTRSPKGVGA